MKRFPLLFSILHKKINFNLKKRLSPVEHLHLPPMAILTNHSLLVLVLTSLIRMNQRVTLHAVHFTFQLTITL